MNKPKLTLHIGHSKTGTTSLQDFFCANHDKLLRQGYLYPVRRSIANNHVLVEGGFFRDCECHLPMALIYQHDLVKLRRDFRRFWSAMQRDIRQHQPHTVLLSSESLFCDFSWASALPLSEFLAATFSEVRVVAYVRSPASDYFSRLAQRIKAGNEVPVPGARPVRPVIEYYCEQFPGRVHVHPFARAQLQGGDILQDFLGRYVPEALPILQQAGTQQLNTSLPWPLLRVLERLRRSTQPDRQLATHATETRIRWAKQDLQTLYPQVAGSSARLKPAVEAAVNRAAVDYLWLRDHFAIEFDDLDYSKIGEPVGTFPADIALDELLDFTGCPELDFPIQRYLDNSPRFKLQSTALHLKMGLTRLYKMFVKDLWPLPLLRRTGTWIKELPGRKPVIQDDHKKDSDLTITGER